MTASLPVADAPPVTPVPSRRIFVYAGFWWRFLAFAIDSIVLMPVTIAGVMLKLGRGAAPDPLDDQSTRFVGLFPIRPALAASGDAHGILRHMLTGLAINVLCWLVGVFYFALFESSRLQATPGKLVCRLKVTDRAARRITRGRALGRECAKALSSMTIIGMLMIGWTRRKQGLHDLIAGTLVLRASHVDPVVFMPPVRA